MYGIHGMSTLGLVGPSCCPKQDEAADVWQLMEKSIPYSTRYSDILEVCDAVSSGMSLVRLWPSAMALRISGEVDELS